MIKIGYILAFCCVSAVRSSYESSHDINLQSVPDIHSYGKTIYPSSTLQELGEYYEHQHEPKVIKIVKHVAFKIPVPYPVNVIQKVPYPVAYKVPHIVKVPHVVKISQPVPVEVIKQVHVPVPVVNEHISQGHGYGDAQGVQASFGSPYGAAENYQVQEQQQEHGSQNEQGSTDSGFTPSTGYGIPYNYGAQQSGYDSGNQNSDSYQPQYQGQNDYSTLSFSQGQAGGSYGHQDADTSSSVSQQLQTGSEQGEHAEGST